jgi:hypothetical protein
MDNTDIAGAHNACYIIPSSFLPPSSSFPLKPSSSSSSSVSSLCFVVYTLQRTSPCFVPYSCLNQPSSVHEVLVYTNAACPSCVFCLDAGQRTVVEIIVLRRGRGDIVVLSPHLSLRLFFCFLVCFDPHVCTKMTTHVFLCLFGFYVRPG